jgi:mono/diheme cytochrome c family protein
MRNSLFLLILVSLFIQCTGGSKYEGLPEMDQKTRVRFNQYYRDGRLLYLNYCASCHMDNGEGLRNVIPSLANSSLIRDSLETIPCQIKYGSMEHANAPSGPKMTGFRSLSDLEVAEITTYITSSWGNRKGLMEVKETNELLQNCR